MSRIPFVLLAAAIGLVAASAPRMVNLTVTAADNHGQPVGDLTQADFTIQDSGKEQSITWFHGNAPKAGAAIPHATLVIFDLLNANMTERGFAADEIVKSLQGRESSDFLYLYLLNAEAKLFPVHALPNGPADAARTAVPWTRQIRPLVEEALKNANRLRMAGLTEDVRVKMTYDALSLAVSTLAMIPGQKNIVWISHGMPIELRLASGGGEQIDFRPLVRKLSEACRQAKVTIHTVDPSSSAVPSADQLASTDTLQQISNLTGGKLFTANSISRAIAQAGDEWRGSYTLGYVPPENWDGKLHKTKMTVSRRGVDLLYPTGYYSDPQDRSMEQMRSALQTAISSPFDSTEMGLRANFTRPGLLQVRVDYRDALVTQQGNDFGADLVLTIVDYTSKGPKGVTPPAGLKVTLTEAQKATAMKDGILITQEHPLAEGIERVRVIVYDPAVNLLGSVMVGR